MSESCNWCRRMLELVLRFTPGMLFFQSYVYTYNFSEYDDIMDTRRPILDGLAILTFLFTAIAIYKSYSPLHTERHRSSTCHARVKSDNEECTLDDELTSDDIYIQKKPSLTNNDNLPYPQVVYTDDHQSQKFEKQFDDVNYQLTNHHQVNKLLIGNESNRNFQNNSDISKPANSDGISSQLYHQYAESLISSGEDKWCAIWDLSSVVILLIDILVINLCVTNLWVFVKYYHLYYWTFGKPLDLLQTIIIPVVVVSVEATISVSRTLNTVFQIIEQSRESTSTGAKVISKDTKLCNERHLVVIQM